MGTLARFSPKARVYALGFAGACTGLGWTLASFGHRAASTAGRAACILAVVACGVAVLFTGLALSKDPDPEADRIVFYDWRTLPLWLALTPMATLFLFGVSPLGIGAGLFLGLLGPAPRPSDLGRMIATREEALDAERLKYRPTVLDEADRENKPSS